MFHPSCRISAGHHRFVPLGAFLKCISSFWIGIFAAFTVLRHFIRACTYHLINTFDKWHSGELVMYVNLLLEASAVKLLLSTKIFWDETSLVYIWLSWVRAVLKEKEFIGIKMGYFKT